MRLGAGEIRVGAAAAEIFLHQEINQGWCRIKSGLMQKL
jgi:hypothetical protein